MRNINKLIAILAFVSVLFPSCLKDDPITDYSDKSIKPIVLVPNGNWPRNSTLRPTTLELTSTPYEIRLYARVSWDKPLNKSVEVTFKEDPALITAYNTKFGSNWKPLNSTAYQIPSLKVTIPAGQQEAFIPIKIFPDKVNLTQDNMLAFTITDASGEVFSSNFQSYIVSLVIKNPYEGNYTVTGYFFHPSAPRSISEVKSLATVTGIRSEVSKLGDLAGWSFRFDVVGNNLTNWENIGSTPPPPQSGFFTADNPGAVAYPGPQFPGTGEWVQTKYNNTYDAANKTFWMHYGYGVGSSGPTGWTRNIYEKWVRQ